MGATDVTTFCRICGPACGLVVTTDGDRVVSIRPDDRHPVTDGFACVKGIRFDAIHHSPDRLDHPMRRADDGSWHATTWDEATGDIGRRLHELVATHGPHSVAFYAGTPTDANSAALLGLAGLALGIGTRNVYSAGSQDANNKFRVGRAMYGDVGLFPFPDIDRTKLLVLIGANPHISQFSVMHAPKVVPRLRAMVERGGRVVHVNPRRTETAKAVGEQVFIRPGTDVALLLSLLEALLAIPGAIAHDVVERHTTGFERVAAVARDWPAERTAALTGIDAVTVRGLAADLAAADGAALYCSVGVNQGPHGTLGYWLVQVINLVTGNLDRPGGSLVGRPAVNSHASTKRLDTAGHRSRIGGFETIIDTLPAGILADEILTPGDGQIRALIVIAGNPALTLPNTPRVAEALSQLDLLVTIDMFRNETAGLGHWALPARSFLERADGSVTCSLGGLQPTPYWQYTRAVVAPVAERRDEFTMLRDLADAADVAFLGIRPLRPMLRALRRAERWPVIGRAFRLDHDRIAGLLTIAATRRLPSTMWRRWPHGKLGAPLATGTFLGSTRVRTPDRRVRLAPDGFVEAVRDLDAWADEQLAAATSLTLISRRERHSHNSWTHNAEPFVNDTTRATNGVHVHPADAARHDLHEGDTATISSATGSIEAPVVLDDDLMEGVVSIAHGWGHGEADGLSVARAHAGVNVNVLSPDGPDSLEPLTQMSRLTAIPVTIAPRHGSR